VTIAAVKAKAKTGPAPAEAPDAPPPAAPSRRRGITPLTPMRQDAAKSMTKLADRMQKSGPDILAHQHVRDAARMLRAGQEEAAQRHLRAAMFSLTPQSLHRNGIHHDDGHTSAREAMHAVHRHLLLVKDITDVAAKNQEALRRDSYGDDSTSNPPPRSPLQADPNAGYGPDALAQKPTARQPPGNQALNAPARTNSGGSDPNVADPVGTQPRGSKQFSYEWDDLCRVIALTAPAPRRVIDLVGPHGYEHNWVFVGIPAAGSKVRFASGHHAVGTVEKADATHVHVRMADGSTVRVPHNGKAGPGALKRAAAGGEAKVPGSSHASSDGAKATGKAVTSSNADSLAGLKTAKADLYRAIQARQANPKSAKLQANETAARQRFGAAQEAHDRARGMPVLTKTGTGPDGTVTAVDQHGTEHKISLDEDGSLTVTRNGETATIPNAGENPTQTARIMSMYMARGRKDQTGAKTADRLTAIPNATDRQAAAQGLTSGELRATDAEFARRAALLGKPGQQSRAHKAVTVEMQKRGLAGNGAKPNAAGTELAYSWGDLASAVELSAQTAALEHTPAPYGKPGGPGLYGVAGNKHSDYFEQIVKALMEKRGMDKGRASAIAWGVLRKWAHGGGGVHPEVAAAASRALAGEAAASAKAHAHAVSWDQVSRDIELATVLEFFNPAQPRLPVGPGGGQFAPASGAQQGASGQQQAKGKSPAKPPAAPPLTAHQQHVAHVAHQLKVSTQKAELLVTAQNDKAKASALIKQRDALAKALASASGKTSKGQAGAKTAATAKTKTTAPASGKTASTGTTASTKTATTSTAPKKTATAAKAPSATAAAPKAGSAAAVKAQIAQLNLQINSLLQAAAQASAQAAKMQ